MRSRRPFLLAATLLAGCAPSPPPPPPSPPPAPPPIVAPVVTAAPTAAPTARPDDGSLCHFAQGVTPSNPARVCDPCARGSFHLEQSGFMSGVMELDVDAQGMATWTKQDMKPGAPRKVWKAALSREQVASLEQAMTAGRVCEQRSGRFGIPDEATVLIAACFPEARCEVMLWGGEWSERPEAKAALSVVDAVIDDVVKRGGPPKP